MNKHQALRFLLLKHLWMLRGRVPPERHRRIAQSLEIDRTDTRWVVTWADDGERKRFEFPLDEVALYVRGDLGQRVAAGTDARNEVLGERFARLAYGINDNPGRERRVSRFERPALQLAGCAAVLIAMVATASSSALPAVALAAAMSLTEFWFRKGKAVNAALGIALACVGVPAAALIGNVGLAVLSFADPDRKWRALRIAAHLAAAAFSLVMFLHQPAPAANWVYVVAAFLVATATTYVRWFHGSHFRLYPLVFPFVCAGLVWNGEWMAGAIGLAGAILGLAIPPLLAQDVTAKGVRPALLRRLGPLTTNPPLS
jgi:hypothetical protein